MKKTLVRLFSSALCALMLVAPAAALTPGDPIGWVLHSDIVTYIDGHPIRSYNIGGYTYVVAEDLMQYGFHVEWDAVGRRLIVHTDRTASPDGYTADYVPEASRCPAGTPAMQYLHTDITAWIGEKQVTGYNIGGYTCIGMDDLAAVFASDYVWDADARALRMTSERKTYAWSHVYKTPDYDNNTVVNGVYAVWTFEKNEDGEFVLISRDGDTNFTPSLQFGYDRLVYTIDNIETKIGLAGSRYVYNAPHTLTAHTLASADFFSSNYGFWSDSRYTLSDGRSIVPTEFADYVRAGDSAAAYLCDENATLRDCLRVYYNDEPVSLIGVTDNSPNNPLFPTYCTYRLIYARHYALDEVSRVRIEFCPPEAQALPAPTPDKLAIRDGQSMTVEQIKTLVNTIVHDSTGTYAGLSRRIWVIEASAQIELRVDSESRPWLDAIIYYGKRVSCESALPLYGEHSWDCREENDELIFDHIADGVGWHCRLTKDGEVEIETKTYAWGHIYETEGYDKDTAVDGVYAIWEFAKNEDGEFELVSTEGDVLFTPQISFGGDFVNYTIHVTEKTMRGYFKSAPHSLLVHREVGQFLLDSLDGFWYKPTMPDGTVIYPEKFAEYAASNSAAADYLREQCADLRQAMRVWYNGEQVDLIGLRDPTENSISLNPHLVWRNYRLAFGKTYALEDVDRVRIELRLPDDYPILPDQTMSVGRMQSLMKTIAAEQTSAYVGKTCILTLDGTDVQLHIAVDENGQPHLTRIDAMGQTLTLAEPIALIGDFNWSMMQMNGIVLFNRLTYGVGDNYLFWDGGMREWHDTLEQSEPTCYLYMNTSGQLAYCRRAVQYSAAAIAAGGFSAVAEVITARDDFFDEVGTVALVDSALVFTPTKIRTVADAYDLDSEYAKLHAADSTLPATLDELIEQNKTSITDIQEDTP